MLKEKRPRSVQDSQVPEKKTKAGQIHVIWQCYNETEIQAQRIKQVELNEATAK